MLSKYDVTILCLLWELFNTCKFFYMICLSYIFASPITLFFSFVDWTHEVMSCMSNDVVNHFQLLGAVEALGAMFKVHSFSLCPTLVIS